MVSFNSAIVLDLYKEKLPADSHLQSPVAGNHRHWHSLTPEQVLSNLESSKDGLDEQEIPVRQRKYGKNELRKAAKRSPVTIFAKQFVSPLIIILLAATIISAFLGETLDAVIIMIIVVLAAVVSFVQEYRSEKALEALRQITSPTAGVIRNRRHATIRSEEIVPGDIIVFSQGDRVPADAYLLESHSLQTNEASLTGESLPVEKNTLPCKVETSVPERKNVVYSGTIVTLGRGKAAVFATGHSTELGKIATSVESVERQKTPFEIRMSHVGRLLSIVMLGVVVIITFIGVYRGHTLVEMLVWGISVAVAAIPEALPAVIATSLTIGVYKMAQKNAIVRRLPAVETLGAVTVVCSDKTGTLTTGKMAVRKIYVDQTAIGIGKQPPDAGKRRPSLELLARAAALCNDAIVTIPNNSKKKKSDTPEPIVSGDPTEVALASFSYDELGLTKDKIDSQFPRVFEIPFSSERKMMTTVHSLKDREKLMVVTKGAPEVVLGICNRMMVCDQVFELDNDRAGLIAKANNTFASEALRMLAISYKEVQDGNIEDLATDLEKGMIFVGLVGIMDPPRPEAIEAIAQCKTSGINVVMITGDNKVTAEAIAKEMGILDGAGNHPRTLTGADIDSMSDDEFNSAVLQTRVFARVLPEHKLKITHALQNRGHVVAMTGDGVNDAPALKAANIGVAMGLTGTQVAKESSSMILADDNFATIVSAIREGRRIMDNVKKYLVYLLSANIGEILLFSSALIIGLPTPLLAKHILYINLATDGSPAIALGTEPAEPDIMRRSPQDPKKSVFAGTLVWLIGISLILGGVSLGLFWHTLASNGWTDAAEAKARTMIFGLIIFFEIFFAYSSRSFRNSFVKMGLLRNKVLLLSMLGESAMVVAIMTVPALQSIFSLVPLEVQDWTLVLLLATLGFVYTEATKAVIALKNRNNAKRLQEAGVQKT
jgi:Ca2+-transporting ATPase